MEGDSTLDPEHFSTLQQHRGNIPTIPKLLQCPECSSTFTRVSNLNRHLRTHEADRRHKCNNCDAEFTRSDLLARHSQFCSEANRRGASRRRACDSCFQSKVRCDLLMPCARCVTRGKQCIYSHAPTQKISTLNPSRESESRQSSYDSPHEGRADPAALPPSDKWQGVHGPYNANIPASAHNFDFSRGSSVVAGSSGVATATLSTPQFSTHLPNMSNIPQRGIGTFRLPPNISSPAHQPDELHTYRENFYSAMRWTFPAIHLPTFRADRQSELIRHAIHVSGAHLSDDAAAKQFAWDNWAPTVAALLDACRNSQSSNETGILMAILGFLQLFGWFHPDADIRDRVLVFHEQAVSLMAHYPVGDNPCSICPASSMHPAMLNHLWKQWITYETIKRSRTWVHFHDWGRATYLNMAPVMDLQHTLGPFVLTCESELWEAPDAITWARTLETPSPYGSMRQRLDGLRLKEVVDHFRYGDPLAAPALFPPRIAMFFVTKYCMTELCSGDFDEYSLQQHETTSERWLESWTKVAAHHAGGGALSDALPGYLMMQGLIYVTRQGYRDRLRGDRPWSRTLLIIAWCRHIRQFMDTHPELTSELWETLPMPGMPRRGATYDAGTSGLPENLDLGSVATALTGLSC